MTVPPGQAVVEGHEAASRVEAAVEGALPGSDVIVHVEPRRRGVELRQRILAIALSEPLVVEAHDVTVFEQGDGGTSVALHLKFPADLDLASAAKVARGIERELAATLGIGTVQTHLEPLERTVRNRPVHLRNLGPHLSAQAMPVVVDVGLRGSREALSRVEADAVTAYIDVVGLVAGDYMLAVHAEASDQAGVIHIDPATVQVRITSAKN